MTRIATRSSATPSSASIDVDRVGMGAVGPVPGVGVGPNGGVGVGPAAPTGRSKRTAINEKQSLPVACAGWIVSVLGPGTKSEVRSKDLWSHRLPPDTGTGSVLPSQFWPAGRITVPLILSS